LAANDFRNPLTELAALLNSNGADQDSNGIGVVLLLNEEAASVLAQAGPFQNLDHVRWFGNEIAARSEAVTSNADAAAFAATVAFSAPLFLLPADSARTDAVLQAVTQRLGTSPDPYALVAYDALWAIGLTANEVASPNDAAVLRFSLPEVVSFYNGASGVIALNAAGDRTTATYEIVQVSPTETGPAWTRAATFADGVLTPQASASDAP
jgi:ABC-type branched-subunit amino acid transport system substrate-binding protein